MSPPDGTTADLLPVVVDPELVVLNTLPVVDNEDVDVVPAVVLKVDLVGTVVVLEVRAFTVEPALDVLEFERAARVVRAILEEDELVEAPCVLEVDPVVPS